MGKSLTFRGTVYEAKAAMKSHRCNDPICDSYLWKMKHELDLAIIKMKSLENELEQRGVNPTVQLKIDEAAADAQSQIG